MANDNITAGDLNYADSLWKVTDALRGQVDAAEYKHVVLGLVFLKYISDSFESRREDLRAELTRDGIKGKQLDRLLESRDEYTAEQVFWVPPESRQRPPGISLSCQHAVVVTAVEAEPSWLMPPECGIRRRCPVEVRKGDERYGHTYLLVQWHSNYET